jgi:hypothetical protein
VYAVKHGEQQVKCSPVDGSLCIGRIANNLSASSDGQPTRLGFGKASDKYERAKSSNSLSFSKAVRSLIRVLTLQDLAAGHRPFISTQAFSGLSEVFG